MNQPVRLSLADGAALYDGRDIAPYIVRDRARTTEQGLPIAVRGLHKRFGDNEVLRGVDLTIAAGEFVAIVGRSGCGKSTLLRLIAGLDAPSDGSIALGDGAPSNRGSLRVMFQEPRLLPWARVGANVEVGLGDSDRTSRRAVEALSQVGLAEKAGEWPARLSGGQRQRVALARALVSRPRVLLFDEPLGALDALTRIHMQQLLEKVWREQGFTAVLVTHDVAEAVALADRVIVLEDGRITDDFHVDLSRPRERGNAEAAALEGQILGRLLNAAD